MAMRWDVYERVERRKEGERMGGREGRKEGGASLT